MSPAGHSCRDRACRRISRVASPSRSLVFELAQAPPGPAAARASAPKSGLVPPALTCPSAGARRSDVRRRRSCCWTAAFRISARTTSSVIRALWESLSANWSRGGGVGNPRRDRRASSPRNARRPSSVDKSSPAAARSSRYSRYGRELRSCSWYAGAALLADEGIGIVARRQHGHVHLEALGDQQFRRSAPPRPCPAASGSKLRTTLPANRFSSLRLRRRQRRAGRGDHVA